MQRWTSALLFASFAAVGCQHGPRVEEVASIAPCEESHPDPCDDGPPLCMMDQHDTCMMCRCVPMPPLPSDVPQGLPLAPFPMSFGPSSPPGPH
jgi:hypothetical protein